DVDAKLGEQTADHVDQLRTLLDQQIARPVHRQCRLLLRRLDRHEPHRRPGYRFANRFRIGSVGLPALHIRFYVSRRHQPHLMTELDKLARPMMRGAARLDADQAWRQLGKKWQHLRAPKRLANHSLAGCINAVDLKNALGQVEADRGNLHSGWLPFARERLMAFTPWHLDAVSGSHPPHLLRGKRTSRWGASRSLKSEV